MIAMRKCSKNIDRKQLSNTIRVKTTALMLRPGIQLSQNPFIVESIGMAPELHQREIGINNKYDNE